MYRFSSPLDSVRRWVNSLTARIDYYLNQLIPGRKRVSVTQASGSSTVILVVAGCLLIVLCLAAVCVVVGALVYFYPQLSVR